MSHAHANESGVVAYHSHAALYLKVFLALLALTIITVGVSRVDFGTWNIVVAMVIASIKALLVAVIFMHLSHEDKTTWLYAAFPLVLMAILIGLVFLDNPYRVNPDGTWQYPLSAEERNTSEPITKDFESKLERSEEPAKSTTADHH